MSFPLFVSHRRLARYRQLPIARCRWALDSGAFSELTAYGRWTLTPEQYVAAVRRHRDEIGHLAWAAPMDCRRQATAEIAAIVIRLHGLGLRLHGFGVKTDGIRKYGRYLASADSMAWSLGGRHVSGCAHRRPSQRPVASEANCIYFAREWRDQVTNVKRTTYGTRSRRGRVTRCP